MGILDSLLGGLMGGQQASSPVQGILGSILGGGGNAAGGGLGGLMQKFQQAGLGGVANSWVGSGPNQPVEPHQLEGVFGRDQVNQWAQQAGTSSEGLLGQLSHFLPHAVDSMTPGGRMPEGDFSGPGVELGGGPGPSGGSFSGPGRSI